MLRPRLVPCLLIQNGGLVKTTRFTDPKYVGDPINAVKIFNEKEVDELMVLDIDASTKGNKPDYQLIGNLAVECRMPLCYGGGVSTLAEAEKIIGMGVEKVALSSAAVRNPEIVSELSVALGSQSVVVVIDARKSGIKRQQEVFTGNGKVRSGLRPGNLARHMEECGAGEIVINSIDNDGMMKGYDVALIAEVRDATSLPVTALGGASSLADIGNLIARFGVMGAAAGSLFVFKGKYRAVLINYPSRAERDSIIAKYCND